MDAKGWGFVPSGARVVASRGPKNPDSRETSHAMEQGISNDAVDRGDEIRKSWMPAKRLYRETSISGVRGTSCDMISGNLSATKTHQTVMSMNLQMINDRTRDQRKICPRIEAPENGYCTSGLDSNP